MSRIERFEDLVAWQKARELTAAVYRVASGSTFAKDFGLRAQLYVALDAGYLDQPKFDTLMNLATEVGKIIGGLRASVQRQRDSQ